MAIQYVTYLDKVVNGGINDDGKWLNANANEIKSVINNNANELIGVIKNGDNITQLVNDAGYITSSVLSDYYTKTELQTSGAAQIHYDNITNTPPIPTLAQVTASGNTTVQPITVNNTITAYRISMSTSDANGITMAHDFNQLPPVTSIVHITRRDSNFAIRSGGTGQTTLYAQLSTENLTAEREFIFPDKPGTIALTDDIPDYSALPGFGLSWNPLTNKMDWLDSTDLGGGVTLRKVVIPDNTAISIGDLLTNQPSVFIDRTSPGAASIAMGVPNKAFGYSEATELITLTNGATSVTLGESGPLNYNINLSSVYTNRSLVDKEYVDSQSVLESLDEGNGVGYRIRGRNPANFGNIGLNAVDFSNSSLTFDNGALGTNSLAVGNNVVASGDNSLVVGSFSNASDLSIAVGYSVNASGYGSAAFGSSSTASGDYSFASGSSTASGLSSGAFGGNNVSSGIHSFSIGQNNVSNEAHSFSIGRYCTDGTVESAWTPGSPIFKVGNGTSGSRSNAYVLYNDGRSEQLLDMEILGIGQGFVIKSPNGDRWRITVDNSGVLSAVAL